MNTLPPNQRMFHGGIRAVALAEQLAARFNDRQHRTKVESHGDTSLVQIGSKHGTPITAHIADTEGGVLVTMSRDRDWLDRTADASEMMERAASSPLSLLAMIPDIVGELKQENIAPQIWNAINDLCALTRSLAGEKNAPGNPKVCPYCNTANDPELELCSSCGGALPTDLPRICPKCKRGHTSDALFCQACGTRLVEG
ncbi:MAG: zinc ribbon domain-containing protein [Chloroflexi bacterium]|nr:zinc ribbon domain-containing protein [Chloroflexota bacterium]